MKTTTTKIRFSQCLENIKNLNEKLTKEWLTTFELTYNIRPSFDSFNLRRWWQIIMRERKIWEIEKRIDEEIFNS